MWFAITGNSKITFQHSSDIKCHPILQ